jgi:hypothetical protein
MDGEQNHHHILRKALIHLHRRLMAYEASRVERLVELGPEHSAAFASWLQLPVVEESPPENHAERACLQGLKQDFELAIKRLGLLARKCLLKTLSGDQRAVKAVSGRFRFPTKGMFAKKGMRDALRTEYGIATRIPPNLQAIFQDRASQLGFSPSTNTARTHALEVWDQIAIAFEIRNVIEHAYSKAGNNLLGKKKKIARSSWSRTERPLEFERKVLIDSKDIELTACALAVALRHLTSAFESRFGSQEPYEE